MVVGMPAVVDIKHREDKDQNRHGTNQGFDHFLPPGWIIKATIKSITPNMGSRMRNGPESSKKNLLAKATAKMAF